jgi:hypothetical protein
VLALCIAVFAIGVIVGNSRCNKRCWLFIDIVAVSSAVNFHLIVVEIASVVGSSYRRVCDKRLFVGNSRLVNVSGEKFHRRRDK